eukprot:273342-Chlamydomonas_euryale.AAC.2
MHGSARVPVVAVVRPWCAGSKALPLQLLNALLLLLLSAPLSARVLCCPLECSALPSTALLSRLLCSPLERSTPWAGKLEADLTRRMHRPLKAEDTSISPTAHAAAYLMPICHVLCHKSALQAVDPPPALTPSALPRSVQACPSFVRSP